MYFSKIFWHVISVGIIWDIQKFQDVSNSFLLISANCHDSWENSRVIQLPSPRFWIQSHHSLRLAMVKRSVYPTILTITGGKKKQILAFPKGIITKGTQHIRREFELDTLISPSEYISVMHPPYPNWAKVFFVLFYK